MGHELPPAGLTASEPERHCGQGQAAQPTSALLFRWYTTKRPSGVWTNEPWPPPVRIGCGPFFHEAATWLAKTLGNDVAESPGAHGPQFDHPYELAAQIRGLAA